MPVQQTDTFRLVPAGMPSQKPGSVFDSITDQQFYNCFIETVTNPVNGSKKTWCVKRPGTNYVGSLDAGTNTKIRGGYSWAKTGKYYIVADSGGVGYLYRAEIALDTDLGLEDTNDNILGEDTSILVTEQDTFTATKLLQLTTIDDPVYFTEMTYGLKTYLFFCDGTIGYFIDADTPDVINYVNDTQVVEVTIGEGGSYGVAPTATFADPTTGVIVATYERSGATVTVTTIHDHGLTTSDRVYLDFTSGGATDGAFAVVSTPTTKTFTITHGTSGTIAAGSTCRYGITTRGTVDFSNGTVLDIDITRYGIGYTAAPTITFSSGAATATALISGFPVPHVVKPTSLDGTIYVAADGTSDVYNCRIGNPFYWSPLEFLTVNQYPGTIVGLARQANQIVILKTDSIEYAYDAGNAEGSPLSRTNQAVIQIGCLDVKTIDDREDILFFVGITNIGNVGVWKIDGFKDTKVSTEAIDRIFNNPTTVAPFDMSQIKGYSIRAGGHFFYVVNTNTVESNGVTPSVVYDLEEKFWTYWTHGESDSVNYDFKAQISLPSLDSSKPAVPLVVTTNGGVCFLDEQVYSDNNLINGVATRTNINFYWRSNLTDLDNTCRKRYNYCHLVGDWGVYNKHPNSDDVVYLDRLNDDWSSNAGSSFSNPTAAPWTIPLSTRPYVKNLGSGRRTAWTLYYKYDAPFRFEALEFNYQQNEH